MTLKVLDVFKVVQFRGEQRKWNKIWDGNKFTFISVFLDIF